MSERTSTDYEHGVPNRVSVMQPDLDAGAAFYGGLFGWDLRPDARGGYLRASLGGREVAAITPLPPMLEVKPPPAWMTNVLVDDVDAVAGLVPGAGGTVLSGPFDVPGVRMAVIQDPTGGTIVPWHPEDGDCAERVNEPGAWAMSQLLTPDPDAAAPFYAAVFGWTTEAFGGATMFRLPGYVGGEPAQPVSREVVAVMARADVAPHWSVDFWTSDAEATCARAVELGGAVVAGISETPVGWSVTLADPAGATFSVSQLAHR